MSLDVVVLIENAASKAVDPSNFQALLTSASADDVILLISRKKALANVCSAGNVDLLQYLIRAGAEPNVLTDDGERPLFKALRGSHLACVRMLLANGADPNGRSEWTLGGRSALHVACDKGMNWRLVDPAAIPLLLSYGAEVSARNRDRSTPLHIAAWDGSATHVEMLLDAGADIHALNCMGNTPLHCAVIANNLSTVEALLARGSSVELRNNSGRTPLDETRKEEFASFGQRIPVSLDIVKLLIAARGKMKLP